MMEGGVTGVGRSSKVVSFLKMASIMCCPVVASLLMSNIGPFRILFCENLNRWCDRVRWSFEREPTRRGFDFFEVLSMRWPWNERSETSDGVLLVGFFPDDSSCCFLFAARRVGLQ